MSDFPELEVDMSKLRADLRKETMDSLQCKKNNSKNVSLKISDTIVLILRKNELAQVSMDFTKWYVLCEDCGQSYYIEDPEVAKAIMEYLSLTFPEMEFKDKSGT